MVVAEFFFPSVLLLPLDLALDLPWVSRTFYPFPCSNPPP